MAQEEYFSEGVKSLFPNMLFPGRNFQFWHTPNKFKWFRIVTSKVLYAVYYFFPFHFHLFSFSHLPFTIFLLFSPFSFFSLPLGQQNFPGEKCQGTFCPLPPPRLSRHCLSNLCIIHT